MCSAVAIKLVVENMRCIEKAELQLRPGSRTILIGRNNSGKTTLLDAVTKGLWSLPGPFPQEAWRQFSATWYRRKDGQTLRPTVVVQMPATELKGLDFAQPEAEVTFTLVGSWTPATAVGRPGGNTRLAVLDAKLASGNAIDLIQRQNNVDTVDDLLMGQVLGVAPCVTAAGWTPPDVNIQPSLSGNWLPNALDASTPFGLAVGDFINRVHYIPAQRAAQFPADRTFTALIQGNSENVTQLLLHLQATRREAFESLTCSLGQLFDDVRRLSFASVASGALVPTVDFMDGRAEHVGNLGFGFQNALHVLTVLMMLPEGAIFVVDEPEKGLNQSCQRDLAVLLELLRRDVTLLVATQSEAFCRGFSSASSLVVVENTKGTSGTRRIDIRESATDLRHLARVMGVDPLYLLEGGKIVYVEGVSDQIIVERWMGLTFPAASNYQVVALGGCGKVSEEFVKPLLVEFKSRVFLLLDSDRPSKEQAQGDDMRRLVRWLTENGILHHVLARRELENYLDVDGIAKAAYVHSSVLRAPPGHEEWFDIKTAFEKCKGYRYDERRLSVASPTKRTKLSKR
jgi:ABC-type branched-subunit amino acid transport system ATPase component